MRIQFRWWDGQGDAHDPKVGTPAGDNRAVFAALNGKVLSGIGGISSDSEAFNINFKDGGAIWFLTEGSTPRVLIKTK
jgi:hypothetical protein